LRDQERHIRTSTGVCGSATTQTERFAEGAVNDQIVPNFAKTILNIRQTSHIRNHTSVARPIGVALWVAGRLSMGAGALQLQEVKPLPASG
jgi:hypothetical protein